MKKENPVVWFEIYVNEMDRAQKFYETVFSLSMDTMPTPDVGEPMEMLFFPSDMESKNKATGALVKMKGVEPGNNSTIVYFVSEDCSTEEAKIAAAGGRVFKPKMAIGEYGFIVLAIDTEGNMIGIHSIS